MYWVLHILSPSIKFKSMNIKPASFSEDVTSNCVGENFSNKISCCPFEQRIEYRNFGIREISAFGKVPNSENSDSRSDCELLAPLIIPHRPPVRLQPVAAFTIHSSGGDDGGGSAMARRRSAE